MFSTSDEKCSWRGNNRKAIPQLIEVNSPRFDKITDYPTLEHGDIETADLEKLGNFIEKMSALGLITPDSELERYLREQAGLPEHLEDDDDIRD